MTASVLITGGGSGIGAAAAAQLAGDGLGRVRGGAPAEPLQEVAAAHGRAPGAPPTSASRPGAEHAVQACLERFGRLDALVVSSGTAAGGAVLEQTLERFNRVLADQPHRRVPALPGGAASR